MKKLKLSEKRNPHITIRDITVIIHDWLFRLFIKERDSCFM